MIAVSNDFLTDVNSNDNRRFMPIITITLADSTVLNIQPTDVMANGLSINESVSGDEILEFGSVIINECQIILNNMKGQFDAYDFANAVVNVQISLDLTTGVTETFQRGVYYVNGQDFNNSVVALTCLDALSKFDRELTSSLVYPATLLQMAQDICAECGHALVTASFPNYTLSFSEAPWESGTTFRQALSYIAQIACCNAYANENGRIELKWYDVAALASGTGLVDIPALYTINTAMDDSVITGVRAVLKDPGSSSLLREYKNGADGNVLSIEGNPLVTPTNAQGIVDTIGAAVVGMTYRKANWTHLSSPYLQAGDVAAIYDGKGTEYRVLVSSTDFTIQNRQNSVSAAATPARNSAALYSERIKNYLNVAPEIAEAVQTANEAKTIADNTDQYFWFKATGSDTGAHITTIPQDDFENTPAGGNTLIRSNGIALRNALEEIVTISTNGQTFNNEYSHKTFEVGRLESSTYLSKKDWVEFTGESTISLPWKATSLDSVRAYDSSYGYLYGRDISKYSLPVGGSTVVTISSGEVTSLLNIGAAYLVITYTATGRFPFYTFGSSGLGDIGLSSVREGENCIASGKAAHAEGSESVASGIYSHAECSSKATGLGSHSEGVSTTASGGMAHAEGDQCTASGSYSHAQNRVTIAGYEAQTALGKFNDNQSGNAVEIGNGTADNARSNALTVDWDGRVKCGDYAGNLTSIFDIFYPVGSYYETSDTSFDPNVTWGGTWSLETEGLVHIGAGANYAVGATGGEATHTLTVDEIPAHSHIRNRNSGYDNNFATGSGRTIPTNNSVGNQGNIRTADTGGGQAHNNMQPYVVVNRWHRTA